MMKFKKAMAIALVGMMVVGPATTAFAQSFKDVTESHWAYQYIHELSSKNVLNGFSDGTFRPSTYVTKEQSIALMMNMIGATASEKSKYMDIYKGYLTQKGVNKWVQPFMAVALGRGIIFENEISAGNITREEFSLFLARSYRIGNTNTQIALGNMTFTDKMMINQVAVPAVYELNKHGIISGMDNGMFNPKGMITRAQAAKMLSIADKKLIKPVASSYVPTTPTFDKTRTTEHEGEIDSVTVVGNKAYVYLNATSTVKKMFTIDQFTDKYDEDDRKAELSDFEEGKTIQITTDRNGLVIKAEIKEESSSKSSSKSKHKTYSGEVTDVSSSKDKIELDDDDEFDVEDDVNVYLHGDKKKLKDVDEGDDVTLFVDKSGDVVTIVDKEDATQLSGKIKKIDDDDDEIRIEVDGKEKTYDVSRSVYIERKGKEKSKIKELERGDEVDFILDDDDRVIVLLAEPDDDDEDDEYTGYIVEVDTGRNYSIKFVTEDGEIKEYDDGDFDDDDLDVDGERNDEFDDLKEGYKVTFEVDGGDLESVEVEDDDYKVLDAEVKRLDDDDEEIKVEDNDDDDDEYTVDVSRADLYDDDEDEFDGDEVEDNLSKGDDIWVIYDRSDKDNDEIKAELIVEQ